MFVRNNLNKELMYRKSGNVLVLKACTVTYVDDNVVSEKELVGTYGSRIRVIHEVKEAPADKIIKNYSLDSEKSVEKQVKESLEEILSEVQIELSKDNNSDKQEIGTASESTNKIVSDENEKGKDRQDTALIKTKTKKQTLEKRKRSSKK